MRAEIDEVVVRTPTKTEKPVSTWVLLVANLVPLAGVLFWGWDAFALLALFWMENVVVGVFSALRMLTIDPRDPALWLAKLFMVPFFFRFLERATPSAIYRLWLLITGCGCRSRCCWRAISSPTSGTTSSAANSAARSSPVR